MDTAVAKSRLELSKRYIDCRDEEAAVIAAAAIRFYMIRYLKHQDIEFDFDLALSFEGDSGPYLQYSAVRAKKIFDRLSERGIKVGEVDFGIEIADDLWEFIVLLSRSEQVIEKAAKELEVNVLAHWLLEVAKKFNSLYHKCPVVRENDPVQRTFRAKIFRLFLDKFKDGLSLVGIILPERM